MWMARLLPILALESPGWCMRLLRSGLTFELSCPVQQPGADPRVTVSQLRLYSTPDSVLMEDGSALVDGLGAAFLSSLPGFTNVSIAASNINALSVDYEQCAAPLTFTNGLRPPVQPSAGNGGTRLSYSYSLSDGLTYSVQTNLTLHTESAFATTHDQLGNPYQSVVFITGSRIYTYLPIAYTLVSTITSIANTSTPLNSTHGSQCFYPYALLSAAPGVYSTDTAPFIDAAGLSFIVSPPVPPNGQLGGETYSALSVYLAVNAESDTVVLMESPTSTNPPLPALQRQAYSVA